MENQCIKLDIYMVCTSGIPVIQDQLRQAAFLHMSISHIVQGFFPCCQRKTKLVFLLRSWWCIEPSKPNLQAAANDM